ncbi:MAG: rhamnulokinase [Clostridiales bacterium]|nr:rhamnulokinase [Clostridiales bacterium]
MKDIRVLAIDIGASSGRGIIGQYDGEKLKYREIHRFLNEPVMINNVFQWDVLRLFHEIKIALRKCALSDDKVIKGIGIDTWGVDYGLLDKRGNLISNPVHYRDARTNNITDYVFSKVPYDELYSITGIQSLNFNTVYQLAVELRDAPDRLALADKLLFMPDLLNYFLTGQKKTEYTIASTGALLNAHNRTYDYALLEKLGIPSHLFTELITPGNILGNLTPDLIDEIGSLDAKVVNIASHDTASAVLAVPTKTEDFVYLSSGTWSLLGTELDEPAINEKTARYSFTNEGGAGRTIRLLRNIMGLWLIQESRRQWEREGESLSFSDLSDMATESSPLVSIVDPDDSRFAAPGNLPRRIADYCRETGQYVPQTKGEIVRCILDSLALKYRHTINMINEIRGKKATHLHIVGGGVQNKLLCCLAADACGIPVYAGPIEATAIGNILVQLMALGEISSISQGREIVRNSFELDCYEPAGDATWDEAYERFQKLLG